LRRAHRTAILNAAMCPLRLSAIAAALAVGALAEPAGAATVTLTPATLRPSGSVSVSGAGFSPSTEATVRLGSATTHVGTDGQGRLSAVLPIAGSAPSGARRLIVRTGRRRVATDTSVARGGRAATALVALSSGERLVVDPTLAAAGAPMSVRGSRFGARTRIDVRFGTASLGTAQASRGGRFTLKVAAPAAVPGVGRVAVEWVDRRAEVPFAVAAPAGGGTVVVGAAGDIACRPDGASFNGGRGTSSRCRQAATARLLAVGAPAAVLPLGDTQYGDATLDGYAASYGPSWGRFNLIAHPVPGDEEYELAGASGYFDYFGLSAGGRGAGYYSFDAGAWHLIALNSRCREVACGAGSAQEAWLRADVAAHPSRCTLAYWHRPRFTSGPASQAAETDAFWRDLYATGADVVLGGHNHQYERFAPQTPDRDPDPAAGIRQFVVGTGGDGLDPFRPADLRPNSETRIAGAFGVLLLTLRPDGYDWRFVDADGAVLDAGSQPCH
jgi:acid phosphatase type 7